MVDTEHPASSAAQAEYLPAWWRCVLVAMATLILCSCSSPAVRMHLSPDKSLVDPGQESARIDRQPPATPGVSQSRSAVETPNYIEPPAEPAAVGVSSCQACVGG